MGLFFYVKIIEKNSVCTTESLMLELFDFIRIVLITFDEKLETTIESFLAFIMSSYHHLMIKGFFYTDGSLMNDRMADPTCNRLIG